MADLLEAHSKEWNLEAIRLHLPQYEEINKNLIPSEFNIEYELVWLPARSRVYSTKTGYAVSRISGEQEAPNFD